MSKIRDIISCHRELFMPAGHLLGWAFFIAYEISLSAAIMGRTSHPVDYVLHYSLYICLFYVNTFGWIGFTPISGAFKIIKLLVFVATEAAIFYALNMAINMYLTFSGLEVIVPNPWSRLFALATVYRFVYVAGLSTAFTLAVNLSRKQRNITALTTQTLLYEREQEKLRAELAGAELSFLRAQINPHLIFNSLNRVYNTVRKTDSRCSREVLALAELMQYALKAKSPTDLATVAQELEHLENYVNLHNMSQPAGVELSIYNDESIKEIIPLVLYTLAENVFQHGDLKEPASVQVAIRKGRLQMKTQNLIRADRRSGHGVGLANTYKRLEHHYKGRYSLTYGSHNNVFMLEFILDI